METIQLDTLEGAVYIKLSRRYHIEKLLTTSGTLFLHHRDGTQTKITIISAETHTVTVRVLNIPLEIHNDRITNALVKYGKIHDIRNEKWSDVYNFAIYSGIHAIKIEVEVPIPLRVYLAGHKAFITYDGHQQSCFSVMKPLISGKIVWHDWNACQFVDMGPCVHSAR
jgi:hypothetical protein